MEYTMKDLIEKASVADNLFLIIKKELLERLKFDLFIPSEHIAFENIEVVKDIFHVFRNLIAKSTNLEDLRSVYESITPFIRDLHSTMTIQKYPSVAFEYLDSLKLELYLTEDALRCSSQINNDSVFETHYIPGLFSKLKKLNQDELNATIKDLEVLKTYDEQMWEILGQVVDYGNEKFYKNFFQARIQEKIHKFNLEAIVIDFKWKNASENCIITLLNRVGNVFTKVAEEKGLSKLELGLDGKLALIFTGRDLNIVELLNPNCENISMHKEDCLHLTVDLIETDDELIEDWNEAYKKFLKSK